nr:hypothetical protein [Thiohalobacter thiocyanaticus]
MPQIVRDDPQFGQLLSLPFLPRAIDALARPAARRSDPACAVPQVPPQVHLIVQDAGSFLRVTVDGAGCPGGSARGGQPFFVEQGGNPPRRPASGSQLEDPAHNIGPLLVDHQQLAAFNRLGAVPVGHAAGTEPAGDAPGQSTVSAPGGLLAGPGVHGALDSQEKIEAVPAGVDTVPDTDHANAGELKFLDAAPLFGLRAPEPGDLLNQDDLHMAVPGGGKQLLITSPVHDSPGNCPVIIGGRHSQALGCSPLVAYADLILDAAGLLAIGGVPGVNGGRQRLCSSFFFS